MCFLIFVDMVFSFNFRLCFRFFGGFGIDGQILMPIHEKRPRLMKLKYECHFLLGILLRFRD